MPKLIGAFILFAALLYFIQSSALMFNSWDNLKEVNDCLRNKGEILPSRERGLNYSDPFYCQEVAIKSSNIYVKLDQSALSMRQFWGVLLGPIANVLVWIAVLFIGWIVYKTGDLIVPIEESIKDLPEKKGKWASKK